MIGAPRRLRQTLPTFEEQVRWVASVTPDTAVRAASIGVDTPTMRDLSWRLADAEIMDLRSIATPGAVVVLPWGTALVRHLRQCVEETYESNGYELYEFPNIAPESVYAPVLDAFPDVQQLLYVTDRAGLASGTARAALSPTGEGMVYHHWARRVRTRADLPIRLYRNARYFRPVPAGGGRAGRGVMRPLEAPDVHEFHASLADEDTVSHEVDQTIKMVDSIISRWHVPVLWSMRPPWTNNGDLYRAAYGADTLLPNGDTVQVAAVYDQGDGFSRAFDIRLRDVRPHQHPLHVTGCVTRRLVLAHVFQSTTDSGRLALHPDVSPIQVLVRSRNHDEAWPLVDALTAAGIRVRAETGTGRELKAIALRWARRGVPAQALVQAPRNSNDPVRVVLADSDGREEEVFCPGAAGAAVAAGDVAKLLRRMRYEHKARAAMRVGAAVRRVGAGEVADVVDAGGVAVVGLGVTREAVSALESKAPGEVLGIVPADHTVECVVTGAPVDTYALVGGRA